jgi:protein-disulfide isomerase
LTHPYASIHVICNISTFTLTIKDDDFIVSKWISVTIEYIKLRDIMEKNNICIYVFAITSIVSVLLLFNSITLASSSSSFLHSILQRFNNKTHEVFAQLNEGNGNGTLSLANLIKQGSPYQGSKFAPVVIIDFSDLQCKLCQRFVKYTEPQINSTYIQTGKVALVFKHLPNRGFDSFPAALAAQCTNDQGKFWQFHNFLYNVQGPIDSGWASKNNVEKLALQITGLDKQRFNSCFENQKYKAFIDADLTLAHSLGFTQTPSFIIVKNNGTGIQKLEGPQPFVEFKAVLDKELVGA